MSLQLRSCLCLFLASAPLVASAQVEDSAEPIEITILHTNDQHGRIEPINGRLFAQDLPPRVGGVVTLANAVEAHRELDPNLLLLSAGDWFQGTAEAYMSKGRVIIDLMNALKFDAATIGNHEFSYGEEALYALLDRARFPCFGANLVRAVDDRSLRLGAPPMIFTVKGVRVGISGLTTMNAKKTALYQNVESIELLPLIPVALLEVKKLRHLGAEVIVLVNHLGWAENDRIAEAIPGIDLMLGGHMHESALVKGRRASNGRTLLAQAPPFTVGLGVVKLQVDGSRRRVLSAEAGVEVLRAKRDDRNSVVSPLLDEFRKRYASAFETALGRESQALPLARGPAVSSPVGGWVADVIRRETTADVTLLLKSHLRAGLSPGAITLADLFRIAPTANDRIVVFEITGRELVDILSRSVARTEEALDLSGMTVSHVIGSKAVAASEVTVGGRPLDLDAKYEVATTTRFLSGRAHGREHRVHGVLLDVLVRECRRGSEPVTAPPPRWRRQRVGGRDRKVGPHED